MAEPTTPDTSEETGRELDHAPATGMPRWVKVSLIVVGVLIAVFLLLKVAGVGGQHGPGRHFGGQTPSSNVTEHKPPAGVPNHGG